MLFTQLFKRFIGVIGVFFYKTPLSIELTRIKEIDVYRF